MKLIGLAVSASLVAFCGCSKQTESSNKAVPQSALVVASFQMKPIEDSHSKRAHFSWRVEVRNESATPAKMQVAMIEFFDSEGFKLTEAAWIGDVEIAPNSVESISDRSAMEPKEWAAIAKYKVLVR